MAYLLDANVFIQAKNLHYGLDFCPAFWDWILAGNKVKKVYSIEKVGDEIRVGDDDLSEWADEHKDKLFLKPDQTMLRVVERVSTWATSQKYESAAVSTFLQLADYYLVAYALAHGHIIVTHEIAANSPKKIKIPNACIGLGIKCMSPFEMLRHEHARFILGTHSPS